MKVIFCEPGLTMTKLDNAMYFLSECKSVLGTYVANVQYISANCQICQLMDAEIDQNDIFVFFTSEDGRYDEQILELINRFNDKKSRIWAVAMLNKPECNKPPEPVDQKQSFSVSCYNENRNPLVNNMKAIAQIFARKIIAQMLSPLYQDEVLYFISHRRADGERIAAKLADELRLLTRERNVYRDAVCVKVGDDAQKDIDEHLKISDVLIFVQTEQAQDSPYIMKELCYALVYNIPILWIQIDDASYSRIKIRPGEKPSLKYRSDEFEDYDRLIEIVDEVEENCFQLIMNSSNQVYSYVEYLHHMKKKNEIKLASDKDAVLAYEIEYKEKVVDIYNDGIRKHYIQCFGRNPKEIDMQNFIEKVKNTEFYQKKDMLFLLSSHGSKEKSIEDSRVISENFDNYIKNIENVLGRTTIQRNKRIILSGAFPDCDEIYKNSLLEAVSVYSKEIIKSGYTLVFGAHPTFQKIIFDIGDLYAADLKYSIEMHMDRAYLGEYTSEELQELQKKYTLILADGLQEMRENMICKKRSEMLICLGGKIKDDKSRQGVDIEAKLAQKEGIPVALIGTVGGRSGQYAFEKFETGDWSDLNSWDRSLNEELFYCVNHRLMINRLLDTIGE